MKKNIEDLLARHNKKFPGLKMFCADIELIVDELVIQYPELTKTQIKDIIDSEFKMLRQMMSLEGMVTVDSEFKEYKSIRLLRLGSFRPSEIKFKKIQEAYKRMRDEKENANTEI